MSIFNITMKSNLYSPNPRSASGLKMIDDNQNKRVSDIFNVRNQTLFENSAHNRSTRSRMIEITEKLIDDKMRCSTPYRNGQKNTDFTPIHHNSSFDAPRIHKTSINLQHIKKENNPVHEMSAVSSTAEKALFNIHEKNKLYSELQRNKRLQQQEEKTRSATLSLISKQHNPSEKLYKQFQNSKHLFDTENRKDYVLEKAKMNYKKHLLPPTNTYKANRNLLVNEQRLEIVDYYEMNQKLIDSSIKSKVSREENDRFFGDVKKINPMLNNIDRNKKLEEKNKENLLRMSKTLDNFNQFKRELNASSARTPTRTCIKETPKSISVNRKDVKQKLTFSQSKHFCF